MIKTITIDNKKIQLKATAGSLLRYKMQFGTDILGDLTNMFDVQELINISNNKNINKKDMINNISSVKIDSIVFFNILWAFAKTADESIPDPLTWLDSFESIDIFTFQDILTDMVMKLYSTKQSVKKNQNNTKVVNRHKRQM